MIKESLTVYHSTDNRRLEGIRALERLFGSELLKPPAGFSGDGNLTTDKEASRAFIVEYRGDGSWTQAEGPPHLVLLTFEVPIELLRQVGETHLFGCPEYVTTLTVDVRDIPPEYFSNKHAGVRGFSMTQEEAIQQQEAGQRRFFELPFSFFQGVETVGYEYRGVRYPQSDSAG